MNNDKEAKDNDKEARDYHNPSKDNDGEARTEGDNPGELDGHHDPVNGASSYLTQKSITTDDNWTFAATSTSSSFTLTGLGSGVKVWVRVAAIVNEPNH